MVQAAKRHGEPGPGKRKWRPFQIKLGFKFMKEAPSAVLRGREKLVRCGARGVCILHSLSQGARASIFGFPLAQHQKLQR